MRLHFSFETVKHCKAMTRATEDIFQVGKALSKQLKYQRGMEADLVTCHDLTEVDAAGNFRKSPGPVRNRKHKCVTYKFIMYSLETRSVDGR